MDRIQVTDRQAKRGKGMPWSASDSGQKGSNNMKIIVDHGIDLIDKKFRNVRIIVRNPRK